jgi:hypothetical protein
LDTEYQRAVENNDGEDGSDPWGTNIDMTEGLNAIQLRVTNNDAKRRIIKA